MSSSFHYTRLPTVLMGASNAPMPTDKKRLSHKLPRKADRPDSNQKTLIVRAVLSLLAIFTCVWLDAIRVRAA